MKRAFIQTVINNKTIPKFITIILIGLFIFMKMNSYSQTNRTRVEIQNVDFLVGKWSVLNKRLKERLKGSNEWTEFPAEMESKTILNGLAVMDEMKTSHFGDEFVGLSIRMFNPKLNKWTIYWADTMSPERKLSEQVVGTFNNGIGEFYGTEMFNGKEVKLRFIWKRESLDTAHWEQAYFDEKSKAWETNWTMEFTKIE